MTEQPAHNHNAEEEEWDASKHGGFSKEELRAYADKLDLDVRQLPLDKVYDTIQQGTHILFYGAVFCPYTQQFTAIWLNMQLSYDFYKLTEVPNISIAKVQCADNQPVCFNYMRDEGFPTVVLYHKGHYIQEFMDRDNVWDWVQKQVEIVKAGREEQEWGAIKKGLVKEKPSKVEKVAAHQFDQISHNKLEEEVIGGKVGILETVFPVEMVVLVIGVLLVAGFVLRKAVLRKGKYSAVQERELDRFE
ncbi:hypothetical protein BCR33DRAFT_853631 [Rhizoclosmatium globosum]|uniref:Thioredoxin domain-containing protein n=1 Tax=Rhizoclosmatium globosum TaxID=329046 RepID=A0A1Y2BWC1_9FUNG|nr:hypothetical protein HDU79_008328 [Rhizoclosmatium sp. JEL0117]ORY39060.1 hypothetical protein BCR33DRAFT_853631 [Rhizoclosmatium globosum]|eukprot:ORY39060.1 hypothetical protein BCR33DRAFT_853631 [Rhizoclosmatium globosum]